MLPRSLWRGDGWRPKHAKARSTTQRRGSALIRANWSQYPSRVKSAADRTSGSGAKRTFQTSAASSAGVLRDRNDLKLLTGCTDYIPNSFAHQKLCHWGYEGNRTGLRVRFVLSHDIIFLYAPIVAPEGHRAPKGNSVS